MFDYFKGIIADKRINSKGSYITVETANVGYFLEVTEKDYEKCSVSNEDIVKVFVSLIHREDAMTLYGFLNKETRDIFQILLSVSGVGAKMAIALLNEFDTCDLISFVIDGNFKELTRAKGVGPKLAQKIILELKDKLVKSNIQTSSASRQIPSDMDETFAILSSLGYEDKEIEDAISKIIPTIQDTSNTEEVIRKALTTLSV